MPGSRIDIELSTANEIQTLLAATIQPETPTSNLQNKSTSIVNPADSTPTIPGYLRVCRPSSQLTSACACFIGATPAPTITSTSYVRAWTEQIQVTGQILIQSQVTVAPFSNITTISTKSIHTTSVATNVSTPESSKIVLTATLADFNSYTRSTSNLRPSLLRGSITKQHQLRIHEN